MANFPFFQNTQTSPVMFQQDPALMQRSQLAKELMDRGQKQEMLETPMEAIGKLAQILSGAYQQKGVMDEINNRRTAATDTWKKALGGQDWTNPDTGVSKHYDPSMEQLASVLMSNPDTAPFGMNAQLESMTQDRELRKLAQLEQLKARLKDTRTNEQKNYEYGRENPDFFPQQERLKKAGGVNISNVLGGRELTPGQEAVDKKYAEEFVGFEAGGQYADEEKMMTQLDEAYTALSDPDKNLTGPIIGKTPDSLLSVINPEAISVREAVEEVVQRNLRVVLGAQFTEKEGERLIARAFNPNLDEEENKKRVGRLIGQIKTAYRQKKSAAAYFNKHGTLRGWGGSLPTTGDFYEAIDKETEDKPKNISDMSNEELMKLLGL